MAYDELNITRLESDELVFVLVTKNNGKMWNQILLLKGRNSIQIIFKYNENKFYMFNFNEWVKFPLSIFKP